MNNSDKAYMRDLTILALVDPESVNDNVGCVGIFAEADKTDYVSDLNDLHLALDDAILVGDENAVAEIRRDIQRLKTRQRMARKLSKQNMTARSLLTT